MNKAFVKEPEQTGSAHCPRCKSLGVPVPETTLAAHLPADARQGLSDVAFFCPFPQCDVGYFDDFDRVVEVAALGRVPYPKDPAGPLCCCFGLTLDDVERDFREGVVTRTKAVVTRAKSPEARCAVASPTGQCCVPEVQRYYMRLKQQSAT